MSRIADVFNKCRDEGRKAFIPFLAAGDPDLPTSVRALQALDRAGADIIELGIPFSDPIADGPIIQASYQRALSNGVSLEKTLARLSHLHLNAPLLLFTYLNPVIQFGLDRLARQATAAGIDGVLMSDLTPEEAEGYLEPFRSNRIDTVFLAAPTTTEARLHKILACSTGFLYLIARTGVTGKQTTLDAGTQQQIQMIRRHSLLPVAIGFGMRTPADVRLAAELADAVVVGSAIVEKLHEVVSEPEWEQNFERYISEFVKSTKTSATNFTNSTKIQA
ncbi:MAG TPA: tryptophan synthase subunit alpha [Acidobacteriota bacterium]|jgi:tryptophan synthase alpha chain